MFTTSDHPEQRGNVLYVQPEDVVVPIREKSTKDGRKSADLGEPIKAKDLWKEETDDG